MNVHQRLSARAPALASAALALTAAACGGGGGGGGSGPGDGITTPLPLIVTSPPPPPPPPPASPTIVTPNTSSSEYTRNWGLGAIHADAAYIQPATGAGITVAVVDSGIDTAAADLQGRISSLSTDIRTSRAMLKGPSLHGTWVAGVIAANFNGMGTIGVAYESTILAIRSDNAPPELTECGEDECQFNSTDMARAIDYAVANGARVINMSLGGDEPETAFFEAAMKRAVDAGVVIVASAGNSGEEPEGINPEWPARYAIDPRYAGALIAVGASVEAGGMAAYSNLAGVAANGYIVAPGSSIRTHCETGGSTGTLCYVVSGTSFSAPHVAGALALLLQAFPNITGRDAVDILLRTAADRGAVGTDAVWGRGFLDMARAFAPVGSLSVPTPSGQIEIPENEGAGVAVGQAFGDALARSVKLATIGRDEYRRLYKVDLADAFPSAHGGMIAAAAPTRTVSTSLAVAGPARLSLAAQAPLFPQPEASQPLDFLRGEAPSSALASLDLGRLTLTAWRGQGGMPRPETDGPRDAFRILASPRQTVSAGYAFGRWSLSAEQGSGERREAMTLRQVDGPSYLSATLAWRGAAFTAGAMQEPGGPLGSEIVSRSPFVMPAATDFAALVLERPVGPLTVRGEGSLGRTTTAGLLSLDRALSSQWRLMVLGRGFSFEIEQPLRIERGTFSATLADVPAQYLDPVSFSARSVGASPSGRQLNLRLTLDRALADWGLLRLRAGAAFEQGHQAGADTALGAAVDWRLTF